MTQLLVRFRPLDSFAFGSENGLYDSGKGFFSGFQKRPNDIIRHRQSYYAATQAMPQQSTILGALRKLVLVTHGLIRGDGYSAEEWKRNAELIGARSLNLSSPRSDAWGKLQSLSPVFLCGQSAVYLPCPFDSLGIKDALHRPIAAPEPGGALAEIDYKLGHFKGWLGYDAQTGTLFSRLEDQELFVAEDCAGIFKKDRHEADEQGFYIRQRHRFARDKDGRRLATAFGVLVKTELAAEKLCGSVTMGADHCLFAVTAEESPLALDDLCPYPEPSGARKSYRITLPSPAKLWDSWRKADGLKAAIVDTTSARTLETVRDEQAGGKHRTMLSPVRLTLAKAGSVFFFETKEARASFARNLLVPELQIAGYNYFICYESDH